MLLFQPVILIQDEHCYPNRWGKFPLKRGGEKKKLVKKSRILRTYANHKFIHAKFWMGGGGGN